VTVRGPDAARRIFLLAGEPSGDMLGARLMRALHERSPDVGFAGIGGSRMDEQGLKSLFPMEELSLMGFAEILPHLPRLFRRMRETVAAIDRLQPDMVLTIDSPGFSLRLQGRLDGRALQRVHYVAPQVWAWRPGRARQIARDLDHLLALLPFEPPFFERYGLACSFVGHPIIEEAGQRGDGGRFRQRHGLGGDAPLLCLLPGSRRGEVEQHLPVLEGAVTLLHHSFPDLRVVIPTLPGMASLLRERVSPWPTPVLVLGERSERFDAYAASRVAIAASGTVSLEVALAGLPFVTIYRTGPLTAWLAQRLISVPHVNLVNLILDRAVVPELLQKECRADRIAEVAGSLIAREDLRSAQRVALEAAAAQLGAGAELPPSQRAAERVLTVLRSHAPRRTR
jgi:lipid-A-disaccharide synthase